MLKLSFDSLWLVRVGVATAVVAVVVRHLQAAVVTAVLLLGLLTLLLYCHNYYITYRCEFVICFYYMCFLESDSESEDEKPKKSNEKEKNKSSKG